MDSDKKPSLTNDNVFLENLNKEINENCVFHKKELLLISKKIKKNIIIKYDDIELELGIVTVLNNELKKWKKSI